MVASNHEYPGFPQDSYKKMIAMSQLLTKLIRGKDHGIDLAHQSLLSRSQSSNNLAKTHISDQHHVNVAPRVRRSLRQGTKQKRHLDALFQTRQRILQNAGCSHGFQDQSLEVGEERTLPPRLEINLAALDGSLNYSDLPKVAELSLGRSQTDRGEADDLPQIEGLVGMAKEQREYSAAGLAKQGGERLRNHIGYN